jgi:hypothetical protein
MDTCVDLETLFNESDNFTTDPCVDLESLFNELDGFNDDLEDNLTSIDFEPYTTHEHNMYFPHTQWNTLHPNGKYYIQIKL